MTFRLPLSALALGAVLVGCGEGTGSSSASGTTDLDNLAEADPVAQIAYDAGFQAASQLRGQDSTLQFASFEDGFNTGLENARDQAYAEGVQFGLQVGADTVVNIDPAVFLAGAREAFSGAESRLSREQLQAAQAAAQDSIQMRQLRSQARSNPQAKERLDQIARNRTESDAFIASVAERPGVQRLPSGVLYTVSEPGEGAKPTLQSRVAVEYTGRLADGTVFDQSPEGETVEFPVGNVVPGFRDAILDMRPGETRTVYLPPDLAYGQTRGAGAGGPGRHSAERGARVRHHAPRGPRRLAAGPGRSPHAGQLDGPAAPPSCARSSFSPPSLSRPRRPRRRTALPRAYALADAGGGVLPNRLDYAGREVNQNAVGWSGAFEVGRTFERGDLGLRVEGFRARSGGRGRPPELIPTGDWYDAAQVNALVVARRTVALGPLALSVGSGGRGRL